MRVAMAIAFPDDPLRPSGGVEAVGVSLIAGLAALRGLDVHVVTTDRNCRATSVSQWRGATVHRLAWAGGKVLTHALGPGRRQVQGYIRRLAPDVTHAHDVFGLMVQSMPGPRVFTPHGVIHIDTRLRGGPMAYLRSLAWQWAETAAWADQRHIVAISPHVRDDFRRRVHADIHVIDNPVAAEFFDIQRNEQPGDIFSAATLSQAKNTLGLLEAFALLVADGYDAHLRLAGGYLRADYHVAVCDFIRTRGLEQRVTLLGSIPAARVREELSRASVFALASLQESAPMCVAEAMAAGLPVVAPNIAGLPHMICDTVSGYLVNPRDKHDIARRLGEVIGDADRRQKMGQAGRDIARQRFDPARVAARTRDVYQQALADYAANGRR